MIKKIMITIFFHGVFQGYHEHLGAWGDSVQSLVTMVMMMFYQATGRPSGNHGLFHRYRIEALTMRGRGETWDYRHGFLETGKYDCLIINKSIINQLKRWVHNHHTCMLNPMPVLFLVLRLASDFWHVTYKL